MKPTLDKEIDNLFKSQFQDFEIEPSAASWDKIASAIEPAPKKKLPFFWMAAASTLIILSFGIQYFFRSEQATVKLRKDNTEVLANQEQNANSSLSIDTPKDEVLEDVNSTEGFSSTRKLAYSSQRKINEVEDATSINRNSVLEENNVSEEVEQVNIKPGKRRLTVSEQIIADEKLAQQKTINDEILIAQQTQSENTIVDAPARKSRIRSVGDLVNFVVAKVDKREEKFLKISKTEESDVEITGINLGLFKYKKD